MVCCNCNRKKCSEVSKVKMFVTPAVSKIRQGWLCLRGFSSSSYLRHDDGVRSYRRADFCFLFSDFCFPAKKQGCAENSISAHPYKKLWISGNN